MCANKESIYLQRLGEGDHASFDALFRLYQPKVKTFLMGFVKDEEEVSDMTQDIFFKIWTNRKSISHVSSFKSYLFRMAQNMVYDYFEHNMVKETYEKGLSGKIYYAESMEDDLYAKELELLIDIVVEQMPEQRKRIFNMSRKEGLKNEEIANQLQINKRTVENHITQALSDLRKAVRSASHLLI
jgi:RNA polymerase sigma-70 factor (ECF subfamily)